MRLPGLLLLAWLLAFLPWAAWRSAKHMRAARAATPPGGTPDFPPRSQIFTSTLIVLGATFWLAWVTGRSFGYDVFAIERLGTREVVAVSRAIRTEEERRKLPVYALMPRSRVEWLLYVTTAIAARLPLASRTSPRNGRASAS